MRCPEYPDEPEVRADGSDAEHHRYCECSTCVEEFGYVHHDTDPLMRRLWVRLGERVSEAEAEDCPDCGAPPDRPCHPRCGGPDGAP